MQGRRLLRREEMLFAGPNELTECEALRFPYLVAALRASMETMYRRSIRRDSLAANGTSAERNFAVMVLSFFSSFLLLSFLYFYFKFAFKIGYFFAN